MSSGARPETCDSAQLEHKSDLASQLLAEDCYDPIGEPLHESEKRVVRYTICMTVACVLKVVRLEAGKPKDALHLMRHFGAP